jgi:hypothetical protein
LATHTRSHEIKKWAQSTDRRSIRLWMPKDTVRMLDRLCEERAMRRADLLDSRINEADGAERPDDAQNVARSHQP